MAKFVSFFLSLALITVHEAAAKGPFLEVRVKPAEGQTAFVDSPDSVRVRFEIENFEDEDVYLLKYNTPFEEFNGHMVGNPFQVKFVRDQQDADYLGIMAKHAPPSREDFLHLPARSYIGLEVDLAKSYKMNAKGKYHVMPQKHLHIAPPPMRYMEEEQKLAEIVVIEIEVAPLTLEINRGADSLQVTDKEMLIPNMTDTFSCVAKPVEIDRNCYSRDHQDIYNAWSHASNDVPRIPVYSSANPEDRNSARWFGQNGDHLEKVEQAYRNIENLLCQNLNGSGARAKCMYKCSYFAYVYPSDSSFTIHLCKAWFRARPTGRDSKFGTVVHESAHFYKVYGTNDFGYGCYNAQRLAKSDTYRARHNSDNMEYDVEFSGVDGHPSC